MRSVSGFVIGVCLFVAGCQTAPQSQAVSSSPPVQTQAYSLTPTDRSAVEAGVRQKLKDPTSPLFGSMTARSEGATTAIVCGYVNAKNSFGGYVGDQPFVGMLINQGTAKPAFAMVGLGGIDTQTAATRILCSKYGISI